MYELVQDTAAASAGAVPCRAGRSTRSNQETNGGSEPRGQPEISAKRPTRRPDWLKSEADERDLACRAGACARALDDERGLRAAKGGALDRRCPLDLDQEILIFEIEYVDLIFF